MRIGQVGGGRGEAAEEAREVRVRHARAGGLVVDGQIDVDRLDDMVRTSRKVRVGRRVTGCVGHCHAFKGRRRRERSGCRLASRGRGRRDHRVARGAGIRAVVRAPFVFDMFGPVLDHEFLALQVVALELQVAAHLRVALILHRASGRVRGRCNDRKRGRDGWRRFARRRRSGDASRYRKDENCHQKRRELGDRVTHHCSAAGQDITTQTPTQKDERTSSNHHFPRAGIVHGGW